MNLPGKWWDAPMAPPYSLLLSGLSLDQDLTFQFAHGLWKALVEQKHSVIRGRTQNYNGLHCYHWRNCCLPSESRNWPPGASQMAFLELGTLCPRTETRDSAGVRGGGFSRGKLSQSCFPLAWGDPPKTSPKKMGSHNSEQKTPLKKLKHTSE